MKSSASFMIKAAAIIGEDEKIWTLPPPARHHDIIAAMVEAGHSKPIKGEQGFMTSEGEFVRRKAACRIARKTNQILKKSGPEDTLFSEDLW